MSLLFNRLLTPSSSRLIFRACIARNASYSTSNALSKSLTNESNNKDKNFLDGKPSLEYAKKSIKVASFSTMSHEQIIILSAEGIGGARREALIRNVMATDNVEYDEAEETVEKIAKVNRERMFLHSLPYHLGLISATAAGVLSIPLVFHLGTVESFNEAFVTADVPEPKDLETWLEVGSWSWAWMEPLIGQASFFLLAMQFARTQLTNMGLKPYSNYMRHHRAQRLIRQFPEYNAELLIQFSEMDRYYNGWNSRDYI